MKPVSQIFGLCLDEILDLLILKNLITSLISNYLLVKILMNRANARSQTKEAGNILFQDILRVLENKRNKNSQITDFFRIR